MIRLNSHVPARNKSFYGIKEGLVRCNVTYVQVRKFDLSPTFVDVVDQTRGVVSLLLRRLFEPLSEPRKGNIRSGKVVRL